MKDIDVIDLSHFVHADAVNFMKESFKKRIPLIFRGLNIGPCVDKWQTNDHLYQHNADKVVSVHVAKMKEMNFKQKNFEYKNMRMDDFIRLAQIDSDEHWYYLRALGTDVRKERAHFQEQYPELAADIDIPPVFADGDYFSSVLRISSRDCRLWTHYDTMDNVLVQVRGRKSIIFYSPFDAQYLYLEDGKSPILCPEDDDFSQYPLLAHASPFQAHLVPGDIVFIPALWFHNVRAIDFSVAINVFWYHLREDLYDRKDVYGNKDPLPVARASQSIDSIIKTLSVLPEEYRHLYGLSLVEKLSSRLLRKQ